MPAVFPQKTGTKGYSSPINPEDRQQEKGKTHPHQPLQTLKHSEMPVLGISPVKRFDAIAQIKHTLVAMDIVPQAAILPIPSILYQTTFHRILANVLKYVEKILFVGDNPREKAGAPQMSAQTMPFVPCFGEIPQHPLHHFRDIRRRIVRPDEEMDIILHKREVHQSKAELFLRFFDEIHKKRFRGALFEDALLAVDGSNDMLDANACVA
jgi:hypothetical protein